MKNKHSLGLSMYERTISFEFIKREMSLWNKINNGESVRMRRPVWQRDTWGEGQENEQFDQDTVSL